MTPINTESNKDRKLRLALERADKTSFLFGANLGEASIANSGALALNLNVGIRNATIAKSSADPSVAAEPCGVRRHESGQDC